MRGDWWFTGAMAIVIGVGVLGLSYAGESPGLMKELSYAAIIAGFLGLTVDRYVKERVAKQIIQNVSHYIIGFEQPQELRDQIRDLLNTAIIRRNFEQKYRLVKREKDVRLEVEFSYDIENYSSNPKEYSPYIAFEKHERPTLLEFRCDSPDKSAAFVKTGADAKLSLASEGGVLEIRATPLKIQPKVTGNSYRITGKWSRSVREEDSDILSFGAPTIGVAIRVEHPASLEFVAPRATNENEGWWEYTQLFLTGQHIHVRWFPKAGT